MEPFNINNYMKIVEENRKRLEKIVEIEFTTILRVVAVEVWESERAGVRYESD